MCLCRENNIEASKSRHRKGTSDFLHTTTLFGNNIFKYLVRTTVCSTHFYSHIRVQTKWDWIRILSVTHILLLIDKPSVPARRAAVDFMVCFGWGGFFRVFFFAILFFFERTRPAASTRPPCLIHISTSSFSSTENHAFVVRTTSRAWQVPGNKYDQ